MPRPPRLLRRLSSLLSRSARDREMDQEMAYRLGSFSRGHGPSFMGHV